jgi:uncharacterized surface protein with fasciclin (FAS1) repeats
VDFTLFGSAPKILKNPFLKGLKTMRSLSFAAFASVAAAALVTAPAVHAQDAGQTTTSTPGMTGGSYTRAMMMSRNDSTGANSVAAIAMSDPQFSTLVRLVKASGLDNSLMYRGPLTVFAPTNEAFDKLPKGTVEALLLPENIKYLQRILMYHIVPGGYTAADVTAVTGPLPTTARMTSLTVASGPSIGYTGMTTASTNNMGLGAGSARIVRPDIMASNGVIHVIDTVLLPPLTETELKDLAASTKRNNRELMMKPNLLKEANQATKSAPTQLIEKPLGGSATETTTPPAEAPKQP